MIEYLQDAWTSVSDFFVNIWDSFLDSFIDPKWHEFATTMLIILVVIAVIAIIWSVVRKRI